MPRLECYVAAEPVHNKLTDDKAEAYAFCVDLLFLILDAAKQLEKFAFVVFLDPDAVVFDAHVELAQGIIDGRCDVNLTVVRRKFDCVRRQVDDDLLEALAVRLDHKLVIGVNIG